MTAAHCLVNRWPSMIRIVIGEHNWNENYETNNTDVFDVASIKIHPFYDSNTGKFRFKLNVNWTTPPRTARISGLKS